MASPLPPALQPLGMHHVALIASDYARSKRFYTEVVGLPVVHEQYRAERQSYKLDLQLPDGTQLELFSFPSPPARPSFPEACATWRCVWPIWRRVCACWLPMVWWPSPCGPIR